MSGAGGARLGPWSRRRAACRPRRRAGAAPGAAKGRERRSTGLELGRSRRWRQPLANAPRPRPGACPTPRRTRAAARSTTGRRLRRAARREAESRSAPPRGFALAPSALRFDAPSRHARAPVMKARRAHAALAAQRSTCEPSPTRSGTRAEGPPCGRAQSRASARCRRARARGDTAHHGAHGRQLNLDQHRRSARSVDCSRGPRRAATSKATF